MFFFCRVLTEGVVAGFFWVKLSLKERRLAITELSLGELGFVFGHPLSGGSLWASTVVCSAVVRNRLSEGGDSAALECGGASSPCQVRSFVSIVGEGGQLVESPGVLSEWVYGTLETALIF